MPERSIGIVSKTIMAISYVGSNPTTLTHPFSFKTNKINSMKKNLFTILAALFLAACSGFSEKDRKSVV